MKCQADIERIAQTKYDEACCLLENKFYDGAYYLAGYSIELYLKARICKTLGIDTFFTFDIPGKRELYKPFKVHSYQDLLILSGTFSEFNTALSNFSFKEHWSIVSKWSEDCRYLTGKLENDVKQFVISVKQINEWIKDNL